MICGILNAMTMRHFWCDMNCYYLQAKRSDQGLFENETPNSGLQHFKNNAFDSALTELESKPTLSLLARASAVLLYSRTKSALLMDNFSARH
jgi:hypothetical protein